MTDPTPVPVEPTAQALERASLPEQLRSARMMVNYGHGDVRDEPDPLHEEAAAEIENLRQQLATEREITANLSWAIEQLQGAPPIPSASWTNPKLQAAPEEAPATVTGFEMDAAPAPESAGPVVEWRKDGTANIWDVFVGEFNCGYSYQGGARSSGKDWFWLAELDSQIRLGRGYCATEAEAHAACEAAIHAWFKRAGWTAPSPDRALIGRLTQATRDVLAERHRHVEVEGWTPEHDDAHDGGELARAAACYAMHAGDRHAWSEGDYRGAAPPFHDIISGIEPWPWYHGGWKPKDPRRDLVRAGALILAEIERLDRAAAKEGERTA